LIYSPYDDLTPNVKKLVDDPPNVANLWHLKSSIPLSINLDRKEVTCVARDLLRPRHSKIDP